MKRKMKLYCPRPVSQRDESRNKIITEIWSIVWGKIILRNCDSNGATKLLMNMRYIH